MALKRIIQYQREKIPGSVRFIKIHTEEWLESILERVTDHVFHLHGLPKVKLTAKQNEKLEGACHWITSSVCS